MVLLVWMAVLAGCGHPRPGLVPVRDHAVIESLPARRAEAYRQARPLWDAGITAEVLKASRALNQQLIGWAEEVGKTSLGRTDVRARLERESIRVWERAWERNTREGIGTIHPVLSAGAVTHFLEEEIRRLAQQVARRDPTFDYANWEARWSDAGGR